MTIVLQALARHPVFKALMESVARHLSLPISAVMTPFALSDADELRTLFTEAGFEKMEIVPESTVVRFPEPERFVPLAVTSSAAAVLALPNWRRRRGPRFSRWCAEKLSQPSVGTATPTSLPFRCMHTLRWPPDSCCFGRPAYQSPRSGRAAPAAEAQAVKAAGRTWPRMEHA